MNDVVFILEGFELQSPGQQLLDRFLIGYNDDGQFRRSNSSVTLFAGGDLESPLLKQRVNDFGLQIAASPEAAVATASAIVFAPGTKQRTNFFSPSLFERALNSARPGSKCLVDGTLLPAVPLLDRIAEIARSRSLRVVSKAAVAYLTPLPVAPQFRPGVIGQVLVTTHGTFPFAEGEALIALAPYLQFAQKGAGISRVSFLEKDRLWREAYSRSWQTLLRAAVSRSNTIQGDPEKDGRTQDIVGLHIIETLAPEARGWVLHHGKSDTKTLILVLNGALEDINFAVSDGHAVHSAQLYRPPAPLQDHFSPFARWFDGLDNDKSGHLEEARFINSALEKMQALRGA